VPSVRHGRNPSFLGNGFTTAYSGKMQNLVSGRNPSFLGNGFTTKGRNMRTTADIRRNPSFLGNGFTTNYIKSILSYGDLGSQS